MRSNKRQELKYVCSPVITTIRCLFTTLLFCAQLTLGQGEEPADLASVAWIHGAPDCEAARTAPDFVEWQQVRYLENTYVFRQNKCSNYEAPFVYLFIGSEKSLLIDTGATVEGGPGLLAAVRELTDTPLVVAHSHGHRDHTRGDEAFSGAENTEVAGTGADAVQKFFGFRNWPEEPAVLELGNRSIELLPIPGHTDDDLAYYDPVTRITITGDTLYPGRLYVRNWQGYRASIARLDAWIKSKPVTLVLGTHIEMTAEPDVDYPVGTEYQPNERMLPLSVSDIATLHEALDGLDAPQRTYLGSFIIWPVK